MRPLDGVIVPFSAIQWFAGILMDGERFYFDFQKGFCFKINSFDRLIFLKSIRHVEIYSVHPTDEYLCLPWFSVYNYTLQLNRTCKSFHDVFIDNKSLAVWYVARFLFSLEVSIFHQTDLWIKSSYNF